MDKTTKIHQAGDIKIIEIYTRIYNYKSEEDKKSKLTNRLNSYNNHVTIYNDVGKAIGSAHVEYDSSVGVNAVLSFDYYSPERLSIEIDDGYKYYAHPVFALNDKGVLCVLLNTSKPEDNQIGYLRV